MFRCSSACWLMARMQENRLWGRRRGSSSASSSFRSSWTDTAAFPVLFPSQMRRYEPGSVTTTRTNKQKNQPNACYEEMKVKLTVFLGVHLCLKHYTFILKFSISSEWTSFCCFSEHIRQKYIQNCNTPWKLALKCLFDDTFKFSSRRWGNLILKCKLYNVNVYVDILDLLKHTHEAFTWSVLMTN